VTIRHVGEARQNGTVSNPELVTALDLDQWSDSLAAQTTLPILVRRLILATAPVTEITMPALEGALLPGWDGIVSATRRMPTSRSAPRAGSWARARTPRDKAQDDFRTGPRTPSASTARQPRSWR
jgi:hypothetical protein